jgi:hypothetical protein
MREATRPSEAVIKQKVHERLHAPFGALDAKVRKELRRWLPRLHDDLHFTRIFFMHNQEEALKVADRRSKDLSCCRWTPRRQAAAGSSKPIFRRNCFMNSINKPMKPWC